MTIYLLPGLGADERLFQYLRFGDVEVIPIHWIIPSPGESIENYAAKISLQISGTDIVLIGQSFGGMMAIEIAKLMPIKKIILISSVVSHDELPITYRLAGRFKLNKLMTGPLLKRSHRFFNWIMGATDHLRRKLIADMLRDSDEAFMLWAMEKIVSWKNEIVPPNIVRIHGDKDRVLPYRHADYMIKDGGHLIVANRVDEVNTALKNILAQVS